MKGESRGLKFQFTHLKALDSESPKPKAKAKLRTSRIQQESIFPHLK
jgi:hypothetical protein